MRPAVILTDPAIILPYLPPDDIEPTDLEDWEMGGVGLSNATLGLEYQVWHLLVHGEDANTSVWVDAPNTAPVQLFALPFITWARLAFDQNMHPVIAYETSAGAGFYWWDPTIPGTTFTSLPSTVHKPCVTMDDKREIQTRLGNNDVVMTYVNLSNLCYRLERDRYGVEYVWLANITSLISNPFVNRIGMTTQYRLLLEIHGALYL
jgi:hypothetical protein